MPRERKGAPIVSMMLLHGVRAGAKNTPGHEGTLGKGRRQATTTAGSWGLVWGVLGGAKKAVHSEKSYQLVSGPLF